MSYDYLDTISLASLPSEDRFPAWRAILGRKTETARTFEIHCWAEEKEWVEVALQYGEEKEGGWAHGTVIAWPVTEEFLHMLLHTPKPEAGEGYDKLTPFFSIFFDNGFSSEFYGTELHVWLSL